MITLEAADYLMVLESEIGGSIARFEHRGKPLLRGSTAPAGPLDCGSFPLVPYCNRIRDGHFAFRGRSVDIAPNMAGDASPLHGDGWLAPWRVADQGADFAALSFDHAPGAWPWAYQARQEFRLDETGLTAEISCTNRSVDPMPCGLGFHPYFPCDAETMIATEVAEVWEVDDRILPTGTTAATGRYALNGTHACGRGLDNGYGGWRGVMTLTQGDGAATRMYSPDAEFFQVYSPESGGLIAAEPVSHANAALNEPEGQWPALGLRILGPGETMRLRMTLSRLSG